MLKTLLGVIVLAGAPATAALADDRDGRPIWNHSEAHGEHYDYHDEVGREHEDAHEEGFYNRRDHRAYHRALRREHRDFHDDHPNTRHDHYRYYQGIPWYGQDYYAHPRYDYGYYRWGW